MTTFLLLNGADMDAATDQEEQLMLDLAAGHMSRDREQRFVQIVFSFQESVDGFRIQLPLLGIACPFQE